METNQVKNSKMNQECQAVVGKEIEWNKSTLDKPNLSNKRKAKTINNTPYIEWMKIGRWDINIITEKEG